MSEHYDLLNACYHEVSHAIVGLLNHIKPRECVVKINDNEEFGFINTYTLTPELYSTPIKNYIINGFIYFYYAGVVADRYLFTLSTDSDRFPYIIKEGASEDVKQISGIIKKYNLADPGSHRYYFKQKMLKKTKKMVVENWEDITLLSKAFFNKKNNKITYEEIKKILIKKSSNKLFWKQRFVEIDLVYSKFESELIDSEIKETFKL